MTTNDFIGKFAHVSYLFVPCGFLTRKAVIIGIIKKLVDTKKHWRKSGKVQRLAYLIFKMELFNSYKQQIFFEESPVKPSVNWELLLGLFLLTLPQS